MYNQIIQLTNVTICNVVTCLRHKDNDKDKEILFQVFKTNRKNM